MTLSNLTQLEYEMLEAIISFYDVDNDQCYDAPLSERDKGVIGSLVKKGFIYDSNINGAQNSADESYGHNFFPSPWVINNFTKLA